MFMSRPLESTTLVPVQSFYWRNKQVLWVTFLKLVRKGYKELCRNVTIYQIKEVIIHKTTVFVLKNFLMPLKEVIVLKNFHSVPFRTVVYVLINAVSQIRTNWYWKLRNFVPERPLCFPFPINLYSRRIFFWYHVHPWLMLCSRINKSDSCTSKKIPPKTPLLTNFLRYRCTVDWFDPVYVNKRMYYWVIGEYDT